MIDLGQGVPQLILVIAFYVTVIAAAVWLIGYLFPSPTHASREKPRPEAADGPPPPSATPAERPNASGARQDPDTAGGQRLAMDLGGKPLAPK